MPATTISLAAHKGGTGKTVSSLAISSSLARIGHRTLLLDLDPQAHSTMGIGVELEDTDLTVLDIFVDRPKPITEIICPTHLENLDIVPSSIRLERISQFLYTRPRREQLLKTALAPIAERYEYTIIDTHPSLGPLTENAIAAADLIIIPCMMEARAPDGLVDVLELITILRGEDFNNWRILLTKVDTRKTVTNEAVTLGLSHWQKNILNTSIPQSEPLNQAQMQRTDIFTFDPRCKGALAYNELREEILAHASKKKSKAH